MESHILELRTCAKVAASLPRTAIHVVSKTKPLTEGRALSLQPPMTKEASPLVGGSTVPPIVFVAAMHVSFKTTVVTTHGSNSRRSANPTNPPKVSTKTRGYTAQISIGKEQ